MGSKKYFVAGLVFPRSESQKLAIVYNFCRLIDDAVDESDDPTHTLAEYRRKYIQALRSNEKSGIDTIDDFVDLQGKYQIHYDWVESLFDSMNMDLAGEVYETFEQIHRYTYGVAEVVGLMLCKVYNVDPESYEYARLAGRSAQWANFIRDIGYDLRRGRVYIPQEVLARYGFEQLTKESIKSNETGFKEMVRYLIEYYHELHISSQLGYRYLPEFLIQAVEVAAHLDSAVLAKIEKDPLIVMRKQVRPSLRQMYQTFKKYRQDELINIKREN